jgi:hypothetical protein
MDSPIFYRAELWSEDNIELVEVIETKTRSNLRVRVNNRMNKINDPRDITSWKVYQIVNYPFRKIDIAPFKK